jgi:hypothetical protein
MPPASGWLLDPEDGGNTNVRNVGELVPGHTTSHARGRNFSRKTCPNLGLQLAKHGLCETTGEVNVNLTLCLIKHHATKTSRRVEVQFHTFLTSAVIGVEWAASRSGVKAPRTDRTGEPQSRSGRCGKQKSHAYSQNRSPIPWSSSP